MTTYLDTADTINQLYSSIFHYSDIELENQNVEYLGARLKLNKHSVRFRKGKVSFI